jgi:hypothetical protein
VAHRQRSSGLGILGLLVSNVYLAARHGAFHHKGLGMSDADKARIGAELTGGKAAVGVLATAEEAGAITGKLAELGGGVEAIDVTDEALEAVAEAAPEETEAPAEA